MYTSSEIFIFLILLIGNQGNQWRMGRANVPANAGNIQVVFEAVRGRSFTSDIAIDDVTLRNGGCAQSTGQYYHIVYSIS